ncbi:trypsin-like serine protease [Exilibacterium tricleocarpae]|uniref:Trypsin-like serine protease n=2 Tax=Exilibacterium tricleocarpae TaxID=2591008 RepID=A0A545STM1_9GAMM|nr:trypsin-like peptidase domain-containing protein [Exilibacterium tricleocarpae]TQV68319.1 trypsin-like serine protease [Exilibacterium tricleocarpae]
MLLLWAVLMSLAGAGAGAGFSTDDETNNIQVFKEASPSVVYVTNETVVRDPRSFDLHTVPRGSGTGFVWNDGGYIVTNFHVIEGARQITITLQDRSSWKAKVMGIAPEKDLAVLHIEAPAATLQPLALGDSSALTVGNKVLAIGNPFGLDTTLTVGVVSALGREIQAPNNRKIRNVIQTDAAINPGNSGGPLLNSEAKLIGVNTAIFSPSGASVGIGFAIPVDTVKKIVPQLIAHGRLVRPILGIELAPEQWARRNGIKGVPIMRVTRGLPAQKAGLRGIRRNAWGAAELGDIIIGVDTHVVETYDDLLTALERYKPGDRVSVSFVRDGDIDKRALTLAAP